MQYLGVISKMTEWSLFISKQTIQGFAPTTDAKEAEADHFYKDLQHLLELTMKKDVLFIIRDWNVKV